MSFFCQSMKGAGKSLPSPWNSINNTNVTMYIFSLSVGIQLSFVWLDSIESRRSWEMCVNLGRPGPQQFRGHDDDDEHMYSIPNGAMIDVDVFQNFPLYVVCSHPLLCNSFVVTCWILPLSDLFLFVWLLNDVNGSSIFGWDFKCSINAR